MSNIATESCYVLSFIERRFNTNESIINKSITNLNMEWMTFIETKNLKHFFPIDDVYFCESYCFHSMMSDQMPYDQYDIAHECNITVHIPFLKPINHWLYTPRQRYCWTLYLGTDVYTISQRTRTVYDNTYDTSIMQYIKIYTN